MTHSTAPILIVTIVLIGTAGCGPASNRISKEQPAVREIDEEELADELAEQIANRVHLEEARTAPRGILTNKLVAEKIIADSIEASRVTVVDDQGLIRMTLIGEHENENVGSAVTMYDKDGNRTAEIIETVIGPGITLYTNGGKRSLQITATKNGSIIVFSDPLERPRLNIMGADSGAILFEDADGHQFMLNGDKAIQEALE